MIQDLVVTAFVLILAIGPVLYGMGINKKRAHDRRERGRLIRAVTQDAQTPVIKNKLMGPNKTWVEAQNDSRRRRLSIPRVKSHL